MSGFKEYGHYDAVGLADLVRNKEVSPDELLAEAIDRVERFNPTINAVVCKIYEQAQLAVTTDIAQAPFTGVPFLLKDLETPYAGAPLTNGSRFFIDNVPDHDSELVLRYKKAGFVIFGKTNTPEFGLNVSTEPQLFGPARNPWNLDYTTGGSSGGAAAAVAAGIVPAAHGNDGGGSIRIPASCCGLFGLKPTRGRNPMGPDWGEEWNGMVYHHVITRTVRDSAAILDTTSGPGVGDPYWASVPSRPFYDEIGTDPGRIRVAYSVSAPSGISVDEECVKATSDAAKLMAELGHDIEEASPQIDADAFMEAYSVIVAANTMAAIEKHAAESGRELNENEFENLTWLFAQMGNAVPATTYARAVQTIHRIGRQIGRFFECYDVLITPTLAILPQPLGTIDTMLTDFEIYNAKAGAFAAFTAMFNASGNPAMSVPLHWTADDLPVGVQFVGRYGDEATLFRLGSQLEQIRPWANRYPHFPI